MKKGFYNIVESYKRLEKKYANILHSTVAKIVWVAKRGRPDIEAFISFLCTRVTNRKKNEKAKLR